MQSPTSLKPIAAAVLAALFTLAVAGHAAAKPERADAPKVEVAFVLDTTGSMSGLLKGAKEKIWFIASQLSDAKPLPDIRFALVGYRDRGDDYVTRVHDLDGDLDAVYARLQAFHAGGGGDTPESVNAALAEAVRTLKWSPGDDVARIIFLVGDAPPHMDYDEVQYPALVKEARAKGISVNAIQCGQMRHTTTVWQAIAQAGGGDFSAIAQSGGMVAVATPFDAAIADLNRRIGQTLLPYGSTAQRQAVWRKQSLSESASSEAIASRLKYNLANTQSVSGGGDLLDDWVHGRVDPMTLKRPALPRALRSLEGEALETALQAKKVARDALWASLRALDKQRDAFLAKKRASSTDGFDAKVLRALRGQTRLTF